MTTVITVKNTRGEVIADVSSKEVLKDVISTALIGRGAESYIEDFNQNFVKILENFAYDKAPEDPLKGQMWYNTKDKTLKIFNGTKWGHNVSKIGGRTTQEIKTWVLTYVDISDKFDKSGGTITGSVVMEKKFSTSGNIVPDKNETHDLGSYSNRFRTLYIRDKSIYLGDKGKYHINKDSFIYAVNSNEDDVSKIPTGVIILNKSTGIAVVKRTIGTFDASNAKFGQLIYDMNNAVRLGRTVYGFMGDRMVYSGGYMWCGYWVDSEYVQLSTPMNGRDFGSISGVNGNPIGVTGGGRGLWHQGGRPGWNWSSNYQYITFSTPGNSRYFGEAVYRALAAQGVSDGSKGVFSGGWNSWWASRSDVEYVTISTPSNYKNFGSSWVGRFWSNTHITDGTKGVNAGGYYNWWNIFSSMDYITIATPSNGSYFGELRWNRYCNTGNTNGVKGFVFGGWWAPSGSIEVLTIATPGGSAYFGNTGNYMAHAASSSNGVTISIAGGWSYGWCGWRQIRSFDANTPGNTNYFGNIGQSRQEFDATSGN
jgi:hypothetical protein